MSRHALGSRGERVRAAAAAIAVNLFLGAALVTGLALREEQRESDALDTFDVALEPPPPPEKQPEPPREQDPLPEPEGAAGREASPIVAVPTPIARPSPVAAAPVPANGSGTSAGNGNQGVGSGAGGAGSGTGGGGASQEPIARARIISGMIGDRDNRGGRHVGRVVVELSIAANGRVTGCRLIEGSGDPVTDQLTCRLSYRIQFRPARLASGQPVPDHTFYVVNWRRR